MGLTQIFLISWVYWLLEGIYTNGKARTFFSTSINLAVVPQGLSLRIFFDHQYHLNSNIVPNPGLES